MDFIQKVQGLHFLLKLIFQMFICLLQSFKQLFQFQHNFFHEKYLFRNMNHKKIQNQLEAHGIIKHRIHFLKIILKHEQMNAKKSLFPSHLQIYKELTHSLLQVFY